MTADSLIQVLLAVWVVVLAFFLLRILMLRLHHRFPLFSISNGIDLASSLAMIFTGITSSGMVTLGLLSSTIEIVLLPFVALELFSAAREQDRSTVQLLGPSVVALLLGAGLLLFLRSNPDADSFEAVGGFIYLTDTVMNFFVLGYSLRQLRQSTALQDKNTIWLKRFFVLGVICNALRNLLDPMFTGSATFTYVDVATLAATIIFAAVCTVALRKQATQRPAA